MSGSPLVPGGLDLRNSTRAAEVAFAGRRWARGLLHNVAPAFDHALGTDGSAHSISASKLQSAAS